MRMLMGCSRSNEITTPSPPFIAAACAANSKANAELASKPLKQVPSLGVIFFTALFEGAPALESLPVPSVASADKLTASALLMTGLSPSICIAEDSPLALLSEAMVPMEPGVGPADCFAGACVTAVSGRISASARSPAGKKTWQNSNEPCFEAKRSRSGPARGCLSRSWNNPCVRVTQLLFRKKKPPYHCCGG